MVKHDRRENQYLPTPVSPQLSPPRSQPPPPLERFLLPDFTSHKTAPRETIQLPSIYSMEFRSNFSMLKEPVALIRLSEKNFVVAFDALKTKNPKRSI